MDRGFFNVRVPDCETCQLHTVSCKHPKMAYGGKGTLGILVIKAIPSSEEDIKGSYGHGKEHEFLAKAFSSVGVDIMEDCYVTSVLGCRKARNAEPTGKETGFCKPRLDAIIDKLNPRVIILVGSAPFNAIIKPRSTGRLTDTDSIKFAGECIPDQEYGKWICPIWDVSYLLSRRTYDDGAESKPLWERDKAAMKIYKQHIFEACSHWEKTVEIVDYEAMCHITEDIDTATEWIEEALGWEYVSFDYETTGLKCHKKGHKIVSASISNGEVSYSFPFFDDRYFLGMWKRLMLSAVKKIAHNISYEYQWTKGICGYWFNPIFYDTMLGAHCIHNQKPVGLKFCTYANLGVIGYDDSCNKYLKASTKDVELYGDNAFNTMLKAPIRDVLLYNAMDSLFTYKLWLLQKEQLNEAQKEGMEFFMESTQYLAKTSSNGFVLDTEQFDVVKKELEGKIALAECAIKDSSEVALWDKEKEFNFNSGAQLGHLLYDILGIKPPKLTDGGAPSTDADTLDKVDNPLVALILHQRKLKKLLGTYVNQYAVEAVDGMVYPQFYLNRVETFRSSAGSVNIQNLPERDEDAKMMIKSLILPKRGHKLISYDHKSLEVLINACHSGDANLVAYTSDPTKDMHRDSAADIFMLDPKDVSKGLRSGTKGAFVFSSMYGSYYKQTAPDCWELAKQESLLGHLASKGIDTFAKFEARVKKAEEIMWNERFATHDAWRKQQWKDYQKQGYLDSLTGFRMQAPMRRNNTFNSPVQGDAYHILQWGYNNVYREIERLGLDVLPWAEIHDAGDYSTNPADEGTLDALVWLWYTQKVKEKWPWITVNLQVEKAAGEIDGNWATLKAIGYLGENGGIL